MPIVLAAIGQRNLALTDAGQARQIAGSAEEVVLGETGTAQPGGRRPKAT